MPWKVKKVRRFGPFWLSTSRERTDAVDLRVGRSHPGHRPIFGDGGAAAPSRVAPEQPLFGQGRVVADAPVAGERVLRVVPLPVPPEPAPDVPSEQPQADSHAAPPHGVPRGA